MKIIRNPKVIALILSSLLLCVGIAIVNVAQDEPPPDVSDLEMPESKLSDDAFQLRVIRGELGISNQIVRELDDLENAGRNNVLRHSAGSRFSEIASRWDGPQMDVVLAKIPTDFWPNLDDAMQAPKERTWHFGESLSNISLARVMRYRAWRLAQSGDADVALLFAGKIAKLSHAHGEISADGVDAMVIFMVMEIGYQTIWDIAANFSVSSESLQQARQMIQESRFTDDQLRLMFRRGFSIGSKIVRVYYEEVQLDGIWEDGAFIGEPYCQDNFMTLPGANRILPSAFLYKPNKTLRLRADCFREMMSWIKPETDGRAAQQLMDDFKKNKIRSLARGRFLYDPYDALGRAAVVWSIDGFPSLLKRKLYYDSSASVTETALAVREYEMKYAKLPESLSELVPEFLSSVPTDYMDGQPIRYSKEERAVWSIGKKFDLTIPLPPPGSNDERLDSICRIPVLPNR